MNEPDWINEEDCVAFHAMMIDRFGGIDGIRDRGLLLSALARPQQHFHYSGNDHFALAAAYAHGIVKNHPFLDGNKRSGFLCAAFFLELNGHRFNAPEEYVVLQTLALASGEISEKEYALWLADSCGELDRPLPLDP